MTPTDHRPARRPPRLLLFASCLLILVSCVWTSGLWLPAIGEFLVVSDPLEAAEAVLVLGGGGPQRVAGGVEVFQAGYAAWFVVTDNWVNMPGVRADYAELMRTEAMWQGVPAERILSVPEKTRTTYEEALALRTFVEGRGWSSLIVVTDPFHTRRARQMFQDAFRGAGVRIVVRSVNPSWYDPARWWQNDDALRETWTEYMKLGLYFVGGR